MRLPRRLARVRSTARLTTTVLRGLLQPSPDRAEADADAAVAVDLPAPDGVTGYARHVHAQRLVTATPSAVADLVGDLDRVHEWLTLHLSWRGERPARLAAGEQLTQLIKLMDIPAQARWQVEAAGPDGFELRGTGPMGITVGLWCALEQAPGGTAVRLDGALDGPPVRGPIGLTAVRSVETALTDSLRLLDEVLQAGGAGRARFAQEPVLHRRTGRSLEPSTPVVVGVGQVVVRRPDLDDPEEPAALAARALRAAADDAGASHDLLAAADLAYAVPSASWSYADQAGLVAGLVGADEAGTVQTSQYGGDGAQLAVNDAAQAIADGAAHVVLVSGAEAGATVAALQARGREPEWTRQPDDAAPHRVVGTDRPANNEAETSVGLGAPIYVYALLESALRAAAGTAAEEHRADIAELWARHSRVAAGNPFAWDPTARTADEIAVAGPGNRAVADPYTKLMCANLTVDLAAGVVVTSVAAAEALGIPQDRWVFPCAGASATDEWFVSERADLAASPAIAAAGAAVLEHSGITADDLGPVDLYSCFPAAVQLGAAALGLPWGDPRRPLSVTGGLTSAGGPGNGYGLHAVATMVPLLREQPEAHGLCSSLGWYATKHSLGVLSATPPQRRFAHLRPAVERPAPRPVTTELEGEAVLEALTVSRDHDGRAEWAAVSVLTPDGGRVLLRRDDPAELDLLTGTDPLRCAVNLEDGVLVLGEPGQHLPPPPPPPVRTERHEGDVWVITLDRPRVRNAIDLLTAQLLERAVDDAEDDDSLRAVVLTGAGGTFCAGMDLTGAHRGSVPLTDRRGPLGLTAAPPVTPMVAAVEGPALAGGFELVLCADLVVAGETASFGLPEVRRGLLAAAGGLWRTGVRLPRPVALELALVGDPLPACRLHELGLVNAVVPAGGALDAALDLAHRIAANAPLSVAVGKQVVDAAASWSLEEGFTRQSEMASPVLLSDDAAEGVAAFTERRAPRWTGR